MGPVESGVLWSLVAYAVMNTLALGYLRQRIDRLERLPETEE